MRDVLDCVVGLGRRSRSSHGMQTPVLRSVVMHRPFNVWNLHCWIDLLVFQTWGAVSTVFSDLRSPLSPSIFRSWVDQDFLINLRIATIRTHLSTHNKTLKSLCYRNRTHFRKTRSWYSEDRRERYIGVQRPVPLRHVGSGGNLLVMHILIPTLAV